MASPLSFYSLDVFLARRAFYRGKGGAFGEATNQLTNTRNMALIIFFSVKRHFKNEVTTKLCVNPQDWGKKFGGLFRLRSFSLL